VLNKKNFPAGSEAQESSLQNSEALRTLSAKVRRLEMTAKHPPR
jgi:hypothetical protein